MKAFPFQDGINYAAIFNTNLAQKDHRCVKVLQKTHLLKIVLG